VVLVCDDNYPGYCRVIWTAHVREMTDLPDSEQQHLMRIVLGVESCLRALLNPDKLNLASLGNLTPHLHWHVSPRFATDPHFPNPIWGQQIRHPATETAHTGLAEKLRSNLADSLK
jgi:diadenosine tetraphosphate (Ap4A) HIT family hydrolase